MAKHNSVTMAEETSKCLAKRLPAELQPEVTVVSAIYHLDDGKVDILVGKSLPSAACCRDVHWALPSCNLANFSTHISGQSGCVGCAGVSARWGATTAHLAMNVGTRHHRAVGNDLSHGLVVIVSRPICWGCCKPPSGSSFEQRNVEASYAMCLSKLIS